MFPTIMNVLHLEKHKMQKIKNHNIATEKQAYYIYFPSFHRQYLQTGKIRSDFLTVAAVMMNRIDTKQRWRAFDQKP